MVTAPLNAPPRDAPCVAVLGAGIMGLQVANCLLRKGFNVVCLEQSEHVGGMVASFRKGPFIFDHGPHFYYPSSPNQGSYPLAQYREWIGDDLLTIDKKAAIFTSGKRLCSFPLELRDMLQKLGPLFFFRAGTDLVYRRFRHSLRERSLDSAESLLTYMIGSIIYRDFFKHYIQKCTGLEPCSVSTKWVTQRGTWLDIGRFNLKNLIKKVVYNLRNPDNVIHDLYHPKGGAGQIPEAIAGEAIALGGRILLNSRVERLFVSEGQIKSALVRTPTGEYRLSADYFVSTIPITELVSNIDVPQAKQSDGHRLRFRALILCFVILDKPRATSAREVYFPQPEFLFKRIYEPKFSNPYLAPETQTSLCMEVCCDYQDQLWNMSDQDLYSLVLGDLEETGIASRMEISDFFTRRLRYAYPIYELGYDEALRAYTDFLSQFRNIQTCGRQGSFNYTIFTNHSMLIGRQVANRVQRYFEEQPSRPGPASKIITPL